MVIGDDHRGPRRGEGAQASGDARPAPSGSIAGERLVAEERARRGRERAGELEPAALTARERAGAHVEATLEAELCGERGGSGPGCDGDAAEHGEVLGDREIPEHARRLREIAEAAARAGPERQRGHVVAVEDTRPERSGCSPARARKRVLFPAPLGPNIPSTSPGGGARLSRRGARARRRCRR